jgi:hypothetical protein
MVWLGSAASCCEARACAPSYCTRTQEAAVRHLCELPIHPSMHQQRLEQLLCTSNDCL